MSQEQHQSSLDHNIIHEIDNKIRQIDSQRAGNYSNSGIVQARATSNDRSTVANHNFEREPMLRQDIRDAAREVERAVQSVYSATNQSFQRVTNRSLSRASGKFQFLEFNPCFRPAHARNGSQRHNRVNERPNESFDASDSI